MYFDRISSIERKKVNGVKEGGKDWRKNKVKKVNLRDKYK